MNPGFPGKAFHHPRHGVGKVILQTFHLTQAVHVLARIQLRRDERSEHPGVAPNELVQFQNVLPGILPQFIHIPGLDHVRGGKFLKMPIERLEYRIVKQFGLRSEITEDQGFRYSRLASDSRGFRPRIAVAFEFLTSRIYQAIDDLFCWATSTPRWPGFCLRAQIVFSQD